MTHYRNVLLVDDDVDLLKLLTIRLERVGYSVDAVTSGAAALSRLRQSQPDAVVTDLKMDQMDGLGLLIEIEKNYPVLPVILLTAHGTIPDAVAATKLGAYAFLTKPINGEELTACLNEATSMPSGESNSDISAARAEQWRRKIVTCSATMESLLAEAKLAAETDVSILIEGESGTGKELLAQAIHMASPRRKCPFIAINCTSIAEALFESEMFGHVKGAFTGADRNRVGLFKAAHSGTLFLDEVGAMPMAFQSKLLRALQERTIRPVGADDSLRVDVRIIAASNKSLAKAIEADEFREDLYYRLNVVRLTLPPLASRRDDIPLLANHFLRRFSPAAKARGFSTDAMQSLLTAAWPGNVRQLANVVQHCAAICRTRLIPKGLIDHALQSKTRDLGGLTTAKDEFEFKYLQDLLRATSGNVTKAAASAERNRTEFYKLLKKHTLDPNDFRIKRHCRKR